MKRTILFCTLLLAAGAPAVLGDEEPARLPSLLDLLDPDPGLLAEDLAPLGQFPGLRIPRPPGTQRLRLFPGPVLFSWDVGLTFCPIVGGGAADEAHPPLAVYREYWSAGAGLQTALHLRVLPTADAYVSAGILHFSSTGKQSWFGVDSSGGTPVNIHNRYRFDPIYLFPIEFGGKGYLPLKAPPGLTFIDPNREAPLLFLRIGAGPAFVSGVEFELDHYRDDVFTTHIQEIWWPSQSVLNVHVAFGFEWGSFREKTSMKAPLGLFAEVGFRYIAAPVVTDFSDVSDAMFNVTFTLGVHLP